MSVISQNIGTGFTYDYVTGGTRTLYWGGKSFNPYDRHFNLSGNLNSFPIILGESYNYNMTGVNAGTEVCIFQFVCDAPYTGELRCINPNGVTIWGPQNYNITGTGWATNWGGIGFRHQEIDINGTYNWRFIYNGITYNNYFTVSNITTQLDRHTSGYIWIEGTQIAYIDGCNAGSGSQIGYKHLIDNDGVSYSTGKDPGYIRIPTSGHGKIAYIDSSGVERRTRLGDKDGPIFIGGEDYLPMSGKTPGMIWVGDVNQFHWTYLLFIGYDGNVYRISHGNPFGN